MTARRAVFPGSFDPLTVAHLAIADAVYTQAAVGEVHLALSREALDKEGAASVSVDERAHAAQGLRVDRPWLDVRVTDEQLLVDIAVGYDVLVVGADKWHQIHDPRFYGHSARRRDDAIDRLPELLVVPRADIALPPEIDERLLDVPSSIRDVSSSAVRSGRQDWGVD